MSETSPFQRTSLAHVSVPRSDAFGRSKRAKRGEATPDGKNQVLFMDMCFGEYYSYYSRPPIYYKYIGGDSGLISGYIGEPNWHYHARAFKPMVVETPDGGFIFFGGDNSYCRISYVDSQGTKVWDKIASNGSNVWQVAMFPGNYSSVETLDSDTAEFGDQVAVDDQFFYFSYQRRNYNDTSFAGRGRVFAKWNIKTGTPVWERQISTEPLGFKCRAIAYDGGVIFIAETYKNFSVAQSTTLISGYGFDRYEYGFTIYNFSSDGNLRWVKKDYRPGAGATLGSTYANLGTTSLKGKVVGDTLHLVQLGSANGMPMVDPYFDDQHLQTWQIDLDSGRVVRVLAWPKPIKMNIGAYVWPYSPSLTYTWTDTKSSKNVGFPFDIDSSGNLYFYVLGLLDDVDAVKIVTSSVSTAPKAVVYVYKAKPDGTILWGKRLDADQLIFRALGTSLDEELSTQTAAVGRILITDIANRDNKVFVSGYLTSRLDQALAYEGFIVQLNQTTGALIGAKFFRMQNVADDRVPQYRYSRGDVFTRADYAAPLLTVTYAKGTEIRGVILNWVPHKGAYTYIEQEYGAYSMAMPVGIYKIDWAKTTTMTSAGRRYPPFPNLTYSSYPSDIIVELEMGDMEGRIKVTSAPARPMIEIKQGFEYWNGTTYQRIEGVPKLSDPVNESTGGQPLTVTATNHTAICFVDTESTSSDSDYFWKGRPLVVEALYPRGRFRGLSVAFGNIR